MNLYERRKVSGPVAARKRQAQRRRQNHKKGAARVRSAPKFEDVGRTGPNGITQKQANYLRVLGYAGPLKGMGKQEASDQIGRHLQSSGKVHNPTSSTAAPQDVYLRDLRRRWRRESYDQTLTRLAARARSRMESLQAEDG